jgi:hypothetical protein
MQGESSDVAFCLVLFRFNDSHQFLIPFSYRRCRALLSAFTEALVVLEGDS